MTALKLYHLSDAICAQKVRIALAEKSLEFESRLLRTGDEDELRSPAYLALNPNGYVPTLVHDERVLTESRIISEYLDEAFPGPPLLPADAFDRWRARSWTKQPDDSLHLHIYILSFAVIFRSGRLALSPAQRTAMLPITNAIKRAITIELTKSGFDTPILASAVARFATLFGDMEAALANQPWLAGNMYSLADADLTPYLRRLDSIGLWPLFADQHPRVTEWYARVAARPSFALGLMNWLNIEEEANTQAARRVAAPHLAALAGRASLPG